MIPLKSFSTIKLFHKKISYIFLSNILFLCLPVSALVPGMTRNVFIILTLASKEDNGQMIVYHGQSQLMFHTIKDFEEHKHHSCTFHGNIQVFIIITHNKTNMKKTKSLIVKFISPILTTL